MCCARRPRWRRRGRAAVAEGRRQGALARDSLGVFGAQIAMTVFGVLTGIITARVLGPRDRGLFNVLMLLPITLSNFVKFGIPQANVYFMRRRGAAASDVASNSVWIALALGGGLALGCYGARDWILARFFPGASPMMLAAALLRLKLGLAGAVVTQTAIVLGITVWIGMRVHRFAPLRLRWNGRLARGMFAFGTKSYLQTLASTLHFRIDQYMIVYLLNPTEVGYYGVAVSLTNLLLKISDAAGTVLFPRLAASAERDAHAATSRVCRTTLFVTVAVALAYAAAGPLAIRVLYGQRFVPSIRPMLLMLPGIVMISLYLILTRNFTSRNRQEVNIVAAFAALAINVGCNWVLIPRWGIAGAAVSTAISYSVAALVLLAVFVRESGHTVAETVVIDRGDVEALLRLVRRPRPVPLVAGLRASTIPDTRRKDA